MPSLADLVPEIAAYQQSQQRGQQQQLGQLQQMGALQGIVARMKEAQQQEAYRSGLRPDMTPEEQIAHAARFSGPEAVMRTGTSHLDRQATLEAARTNQQAQREQRIAELTQRGEQEIARVREAAAQQRITKEEADAREARTREMMIRLTAQLRPPRPEPQVQPLVPIIDPVTRQPRLVERKDAINQLPAATGAKAEQVEAGKSDVDKDVMTLKSALDQLNEGGGITSTSKGWPTNVARWASTTGPGQLLGTMGGTQNQKARDVISQSRPLLMRSIMQATGMNAKQLDSNAELKLWLSTATDPTKGYEANIEALNNIAAKFGSGGFMEGGQTAQGTITPSRRADDVPAGIDPKVWGKMTPAEKKLFK